MFIIPAIDLKGGKVVRLLQGDFNKTTVYPEDTVHE
ncbi:MAG: 1-(5-phosphoribosyl)-5-((5-phosphoribosylamino)methylideneamino)imidazole-4-carboxamide isomerase, partial [Candidatus Omnitrophica bacterium]|nr:1-(5-phosphoribosyl)-5-((5-phosphoribosylamino)methylideneamino)imidazole-4-carboxamide isomerase [Candidatus Omnitrophota bacterium]